MATHSATVVVNASVAELYSFWSDYSHYPYILSFVEDVVVRDEKSSHWVVDIVGRHEWEALNDPWIKDRFIGWRSSDDLNHVGAVDFDDLGGGLSRITVTISYTPPAGILGNIGESLGIGNLFETRLRSDLDRFAEIVNDAPAHALDPLSPNYLFPPQMSSESSVRAEYLRDDPHFLASQTPEHVNRLFETNLRDDLSFSRSNNDSGRRNN